MAANVTARLGRRTGEDRQDPGDGAATGSRAGLAGGRGHASFAGGLRGEWRTAEGRAVLEPAGAHERWPPPGRSRWTTSVSVAIEDTDPLLQQSRLAAGLGHPLAHRINAIFNSGARSTAIDRDSPAGNAKVVIEQAMASIVKTTPERFQAAQAMLEKAVAAEPDNVDLQGGACRAYAARHSAGMVQSGRRRGDRTQRAVDAGARAAGEARSIVPLLEGLLPLPCRNQPFHRKPRGLREGVGLRSVERVGAVQFGPRADSTGALRGCAGDLQASR